MRVIAGSARHIPLVTPDGLDTRPTTDRIKETLFNILQPLLPGAFFLDLFAGSGGIGIEALSRGAAGAAFVDHSREAVSCIRQNLEKTGLAARAQVFSCTAAEAIARLGALGQPYDLVFLDPPYRTGVEMPVLAGLAASPLITGESLIILEAALDDTLPEEILSLYRIARIKTYKTNQHYFLKKA